MPTPMMQATPLLPRLRAKLWTARGSAAGAAGTGGRSSVSSTATANGVPGSVGQSDSERSARQPSMILRVHRGNANAAAAGSAGIGHNANGNRRRPAAAPGSSSAPGKQLTPSHAAHKHISAQSSSPKSPDTPNSDDRSKVLRVRHSDSVESANEQVIIVEPCAPADPPPQSAPIAKAGGSAGGGLKSSCGLRRQHSTMCPPRRMKQLEQIAEEGDSCAGLRRGWNSCENLKRKAAAAAQQAAENEVELRASKLKPSKTTANGAKNGTLVVPVPYAGGVSRTPDRLSARKACSRLKQLSASLGSRESVNTTTGSGSHAPSIEHLAVAQGPSRNPSGRVRRKMTRVFSEADGLGAIERAADSRQLSFEQNAMTFDDDELAPPEEQSPRRHSNW